MFRNNVRVTEEGAFFVFLRGDPAATVTRTELGMCMICLY